MPTKREIWIWLAVVGLLALWVASRYNITQPTSIPTRVLVPEQQVGAYYYRACAFFDHEKMTVMVIQETPVTVRQQLPLGVTVEEAERASETKVFGTSVPLVNEDNITIVLTDGKDCVRVHEFERSKIPFQLNGTFPDDLQHAYVEVLRVSRSWDAPRQ